MNELQQNPDIAQAQEVQPPSPPPPVEVTTPPPPPPPPLGLSEVFDTKDKEGKVIGHYQWAYHKDGKADSLSVVKVVKDHEGTEQVLYKTYKESAIAKKVMEDAFGKHGINENLATVKVNEEYKAKDGSVQKYGIENLLEFQAIGFVVVLVVLTALWVIIAAVSKFINSLGIGKEAAKPAVQVAAPVASVAQPKTTIHPGMSDEQFIAIISAAAAHAFGKPVSVVKFKPLNTMDWTWAIQGRVALHTRKV